MPTQKPSARIDIIMATYNGEAYLAEQLNSIIDQTCKDWRLIIRDDGSSDTTVSIIKKYVKQDSRIHIIEDSLGNLGYNKNFLTLLRASSADYISFCDQDDVWLPQKLTLCLDKLYEIETPERLPALVHCDAILVNSDLGLIAERWIGDRGNVNGIHGLVFSNSVQGAAATINASLKVIALNIPSELPYDHHLALLSSFKGYRFYIDQPLLKYRQHNKNAIGAIWTSTKLSHQHYFKQLLNLISTLVDFLNYDSLTLSLKSGLLAYSKIKNIYASAPIPHHTKAVTNEYIYLFEGKYRLKKIYYYLKKRYAFTRKKDYWVFLLLLAIGRNLTQPESWK